MAAHLLTEPLKITQAQAVELCRHLAIDGKPAWETFIDPQNRSDYDRENRATLRYAGSDPLLQGAALNCWMYSRHRTGTGQQYDWSVNLHAGPQHQGKYIKDTLPYNERDSFISSIKISTSKPLARIAKELQTRLLAHYLPAYRHAMVRLQEEWDQQAADQVLGAELAALLGVTVRQHPHNGSKAPQLWTPRVSMVVEHGKVHLERGFSMTPQQARQFCALVATWTED